MSNFLGVIKLILNRLREKPKRLDDVPVIDRVPVVGYMGFKAVFRHPLK